MHPARCDLFPLCCNRSSDIWFIYAHISLHASLLMQDFIAHSFRFYRTFIWNCLECNQSLMPKRIFSKNSEFAIDI